MMKNNYIKQKRKDQNSVNHWKIFEGRLVFLLAMVILFVAAYTCILQQVYTNTALKTEIERDISSADAVHKLVNNRLGRKDFNEIKSKADENTELFKNISTYMNEIRTLNSTRYIYTATRNEDGRLIYVVDGLDPSAGDVRHPGDPIEKEMVPYIEKALSGKTVYSQDIVDTTWGPIFTACYPVTAEDESNEVIGAFCIEMDMQKAYGMVEKTNKLSIVLGALSDHAGDPLRLRVGRDFLSMRARPRDADRQCPFRLPCRRKPGRLHSRRDPLYPGSPAREKLGARRVRFPKSI